MKYIRVLSVLFFLLVVQGCCKRQICVKDLPNQGLTLDQQPCPDDPTCQPELYCSSWQIIQGSETGPIKVDKPCILFVTYDGNYNLDGSMSLCSPFIQVQIQLSTDGGSFVPITETVLTRATWVPNHGIDVIRRRAINVKAGEYKIRLKHHFSVFANESEDITNFGMNGGTISVEVLPEQPCGTCYGPNTVIFDNSNTKTTENGGTSPLFNVPSDQDYYLVSIWTYHWNNSNGIEPDKIGKIGIKNSSGITLGMWQATATNGQNGAPNVNWYINVNQSIILRNSEGPYTIVDSDPDTWSQNFDSRGKGFAIVKVKICDEQ